MQIIIPMAGKGKLTRPHTNYRNALTYVACKHRAQRLVEDITQVCLPTASAIIYK